MTSVAGGLDLPCSYSLRCLKVDNWEVRCQTSSVEENRFQLLRNALINKLMTYLLVRLAPTENIYKCDGTWNLILNVLRFLSPKRALSCLTCFIIFRYTSNASYNRNAGINQICSKIHWLSGKINCLQILLCLKTPPRLLVQFRNQRAEKKRFKNIAYLLQLMDMLQPLHFSIGVELNQFCEARFQRIYSKQSI